MSSNSPIFDLQHLRSFRSFFITYHRPFDRRTSGFNKLPRSPFIQYVNIIQSLCGDNGISKYMEVLFGPCTTIFLMILVFVYCVLFRNSMEVIFRLRLCLHNCFFCGKIQHGFKRLEEIYSLTCCGFTHGLAPFNPFRMQQFLFKFC